MALLSGDDARLTSFAREYVTVMTHAFGAVRDEGRDLPVGRALAARTRVGASTWEVVRKPLARSGLFLWVETLRNLGFRPADVERHHERPAQSR